MLDYQSISRPNTTATTTKSNKNQLIGWLVISILLVILGYWGYDNIITHKSQTNKHLLQDNMSLQPAEMTNKPMIQNNENIISPDIFNGAQYTFSPLADTGLYLTSVGNGERVELQAQKTNNDLISQVWTYWSTNNGGIINNGLYGGWLFDANGVLESATTTPSYYTFRFDSTAGMYRIVNANTKNCLGPSSTVNGVAYVIEYYNNYFCHHTSGLWIMSSWPSSSSVSTDTDTDSDSDSSDSSDIQLNKKTNIVKPQASIKSLKNFAPLETSTKDLISLQSISPDLLSNGGQYLIRPYALQTTYLTSVGNEQRVQLKTLQSRDFISQIWAFWRTNGNTGKLNNGLYGGWLLDAEGILETSMSGPTYYTLSYDSTQGMYRIINQQTGNCLGPTSSNNGVTYVFEYYNNYFCKNYAGYWIVTPWTP